MARNGKKHATICYKSEAEYQLIRQELHGINKEYRINQKGAKVRELSPQIRTRWRNLRKKYAEMSRQRYLLTILPSDRKKNTQLVNNAHLRLKTKLDN